MTDPLDPRVPAFIEAAFAEGLGALDLEWVHGQGSKIAGFSRDADLDLVVVCRSKPTEPLLRSAKRFDEGAVVLEKTAMAGLDVDVLFVPAETFEEWIIAVESGRSWCSSLWPDPLHAVAGLAQGRLLHDRSGVGAKQQRRVAQATPSFVSVVTYGVRMAVPEYLADMRRAASHGDAWLHQKLTNELTHMLYVLMFARAGYYPPFPKHVSSWMSRLVIPAEWASAYQRIWEAETAGVQSDAVAELARHLLA